MSNLFSVFSAIKQVTPNSCIQLTADASIIAEADAVIFPGQGAARVCMQNLNAQPKLIEAIRQAILAKPFLGICMGLQVLLTSSDENDGVECLGILEGQSHRFTPSSQANLPVPHMGWNTISQHDHDLWHKIADESHFYFVHSYFADTLGKEQVLGTTEYGQRFSSVVGHDNLFAIQAHPEKSGSVGLQLLKNFCHWQPHSQPR